jgi:DNA-binding transcriptional ArsR family regulator
MSTSEGCTGPFGEGLKGRMTPNAIAEHFDMTRQAVSKHLKILTECELV